MWLLLIAAAPLSAQFTLTDLYDFNCSTGGCYPEDFGQLVRGPDGNFYGTTTSGVLSTTALFFASRRQFLHDVWQFDEMSGFPVGSLMLASDGKLLWRSRYAISVHSAKRAYGIAAVCRRCYCSTSGRSPGHKSLWRNRSWSGISGQSENWEIHCIEQCPWRHICATHARLRWTSVWSDTMEEHPATARFFV